MNVAVIDRPAECPDASDVYRIHRSLERISTVATRVWDARAVAGTFAECELDDLRAALYVIQRGWCSDALDVGIEWQLIEAIDAVSR